MTTSIEWTWPRGFRGETLNPVVGCRPIGPGCLNCYAATMAGTRLANMPQSKAKYAGLTVLNNNRHAFNGRIRLDREAALKPLRWRDPRCVFACSMGDLFYGSAADARAMGNRQSAMGREDDGTLDAVPFEFLNLVFAVAALTPQHRYLLLTKRPDRAAEYLNAPDRAMRVGDAAYAVHTGETVHIPGWPLPNVAIGCSVSTQRDADESIPHLLACPAAMRFVSYEPALEEVDFTALDWLGRGKTTVDALRSTVTSNLMGDTHRADPTQALNWVIVGGESGAKARPFDLAWARSAVEQCKFAGVACFVKQLGARPVLDGEAVALRDGKGGDWDEWPDDLRVREWPERFFAQGEGGEGVARA